MTVLLVSLMVLALLAMGIHIGFALGLAGILGMLVILGVDGTIANLSTIPYNSTARYSLAIVPMFILMGAFFTRSGFTRDAFGAAQVWMSKIRGGLAATTVVSSAVFGAVTGSSIANAAVFSRIAIPEMVENGIDKRLAAGCVAASGTLASLIPPSLLLVIFGVITDQSVRLLLIAGILPGVLSVGVYITGILVRARMQPELVNAFPLNEDGTARAAPQEHYTLTEKLGKLRGLWGALVVFGLVMGGVYFGWFTPTQAGAIGAAAAFMLTLVPGRTIGLRGTWDSLTETGTTTGSIVLILVGGSFMGRFLSSSGAIRNISDTLLEWDLPPLGYLIIFALIVVLLGMFLEAFAILVIVMPVFFPILTSVGYDPLVLGIITIKLVEIGLITPPVGLNCYVVKSATPVDMSLNDVFKGVTPFLLLDLLTLSLLIAFPTIITYLPSLV
jgi:C4-dicarboxylate transporter, DctM subunit